MDNLDGRNGILCAEMTGLFETGSQAPTPEMRLYRPYGSQLEVLMCKVDELLYHGPAGTGKSKTILEKIHLQAEKYPGCRLLLTRKTRESMSESVLVTFENKVLPAGHPAKTEVQRRYRQSYTYPNGSEILVAGLDKPDKILSTEFDTIYVNEATETKEEDIDILTTRLRNDKIPYQQLIVDCNANSPYHWLWQRHLDGQMYAIKADHKDNPTLWDWEKNCWTTLGEKYVLGKLAKLKGVMRDRFYLGKWVASEGTVYDFIPDVHTIDFCDIPGLRHGKVPYDWHKMWVVDFGYTHPFVWQEWVINPDGVMFRIREIFHTKRLVSDHAQRILQITKGERLPDELICDWDAEGKATLEKELGMKSKNAFKDKSTGIQAVEDRLRLRGDGKPGLYLVRGSLDQVDSELQEVKKPTCTEEEFGYYVWDTTGGKKLKEEPVKDMDDGMDTLRYAVAARDCAKRRKMRAAG